MKHKIIYILFFLIALTACSDSAEYDPGKYAPSLKARYLSLSQNVFEFPDAGGYMRDFDVISMYTPWRFTEVMDWIALSKTQSDKSEYVSLTVEENFSADNNRLGVFYLESMDKDWGYKAPLAVFQPAALPYAVPDRNDITLNGGVATEYLNIHSNCSWDLSVDGYWLTVEADYNTNTLKVLASENLENYSREANISILFNNELMSTIHVIQKAAEVTMEANALNFENTAGAYELKLVSDVSWTASTSQSWIQVSPSSGSAGESVLRISALANTGVSDRTGYVYIKVGTDNRVEIPVRQKGLYIIFQTTGLEFGSEKDTQYIVLTSNTSWEIEVPEMSSSEPWITVAPLSGELDGELTITVAENPNISSRSVIITASQPGLNLKDELVITQSGKYFDYGSVSTFECSDKAQEIDVPIRTNAVWEACSKASWISVSPESMTGNATLVMSVDENPFDETRSGTVELTIGEQQYILTVIQSGKYFTVDYTDSQFTSRGTSLSIDVITNDTWTAEVEGNPTWITLSKTSGEGNASIVATIADNPSVNDRTATIIIETPHEKSLRIPVSQAARYMTVDCQSLQFFASGGTSQDVTITTDAQYSITCSDIWFSVNEKGNGVFSVTAENNTTKQERDGVVTIAMTDLQEGTYSIDMSVIQAADGAVFTIIGYGDDNDYDLGLGTSETISLTVTGYGTDHDWDSEASDSGLTVHVTGYSDDENYDAAPGTSSGSVSLGGYSDDNNWN